MKKPKHGRQRPDQSNQTNVLLAVDRQNSVLAELTNDDLNKVRYSAYGQRSSELDPAASVAFNGEFRESDTGWYLLGNGYRAYNPVLKRFHSPDSLSPFGSGGLNAYSYCVGDPINHADPTGHFPLGLLPLAIYSAAAVTAVAGAASLTASFFVKNDSTKKSLLIAGGSLLGAGLVMGSVGMAGLRFVRRAPMAGRLAQRSNVLSPTSRPNPPGLTPGQRQRQADIEELQMAVDMLTSPAMQAARVPGSRNAFQHAMLFHELQSEEQRLGVRLLPSADKLFTHRPIPGPPSPPSSRSPSISSYGSGSSSDWVYTAFPPEAGRDLFARQRIRKS